MHAGGGAVGGEYVVMPDYVFLYSTLAMKNKHFNCVHLFRDFAVCFVMQDEDKESLVGWVEVYTVKTEAGL